MPGIFESFQQGFALGGMQRKSARQEQTRQRAADLYNSGEEDQAVFALTGIGDFDTASFYRQDSARKRELAEKQEAKARREALGQKFATGGAADAALAAGGQGDFDTAAALSGMANQQQDRQQQQFMQGREFLARTALSLKGVPQEQRAQAAIAQIANTPFDTPDMRQTLAQASADGRITDDELDAFATNVLSASDQINRADRLSARADDVNFRNREFAQRQALANQEMSLKREEAAAKSGPPVPDFKDEQGLRKEFTAQSDTFVKMRDAYSRLAAAQPTASGDISLVFSYMKILDPGSTVREGEFATAQNAAGIDVRLRNLYNQAKSGQMLSPAQRAEIKAQAQAVYGTALASHNQLARQYERIATEAGMDPTRVVIDMGLQEDASSTPATAAPATPGAQRGMNWPTNKNLDESKARAKRLDDILGGGE